MFERNLRKIIGWNNNPYREINEACWWWWVHIKLRRFCGEGKMLCGWIAINWKFQGLNEIICHMWACVSTYKYWFSAVDRAGACGLVVLGRYWAVVAIDGRIVVAKSYRSVTEIGVTKSGDWPPTVHLPDTGSGIQVESSGATKSPGWTRSVVVYKQ